MSAPPYDEDVIIDLMNHLFDLHTKLCYFSPGDIVYPTPPASDSDPVQPRHTFPPEVYDEFLELQLSRRVVSLLERLPYLHPLRDRRRFPFYHWGSVLVDPFPLNMETNRYPVMLEDEYPLLPSDVIIVQMGSRDGRTLILDTEENTIRTFARYHDEPDIPEDLNDPRRHDFEYPDIPDHYRNRKAESAPVFLQRWIDDIRQLNPIPWFEFEGEWEGTLLYAPWTVDLAKDITEEDLEIMPFGKTTDEIEADCHEKQYLFLKYTLQHDYGWPDNFQQERWTADHRTVWGLANVRYDADLFDSTPRQGC